MQEELIEQLMAFFEESKHNEIIEKITNIPEGQWSYELTNHLGRAYNNIEQYDKALEVLHKVAEEGAIDALWNFRVGYAYFHKEENDNALPYFKASKDLGDKEGAEFVQMIAPNHIRDKDLVVSANQLGIQTKMLKQSDSEFIKKLNEIKKEFPFDFWYKTLLGEYKMQQYTLENCNKAEAIMSGLVSDLVSLGLHADEESKLKCFEKATLGYNKLHEETDHTLIETGERETLCELMDKLGVVCGLITVKFGNGDGIASEWRDW